MIADPANPAAARFYTACGQRYPAGNSYLRDQRAAHLLRVPFDFAHGRSINRFTDVAQVL